MGIPSNDTHSIRPYTVSGQTRKTFPPFMSCELHRNQRQNKCAGAGVIVPSSREAKQRAQGHTVRSQKTEPILQLSHLLATHCWLQCPWRLKILPLPTQSRKGAQRWCSYVPGWRDGRLRAREVTELCRGF